MNLRKRSNHRDTTANKKKRTVQKKGSLMVYEIREVEKILDKQIWNNTVRYFIKWVGLPDIENTWEDEKFCDCPDKIREYEERVKREEEEKIRLKAEMEAEKARRKAEREAERAERRIERAAEKEREKEEKAKIRAEKARLRAEKLMQKEKEAALKKSQESETVQPSSEENNLDDTTIKNDCNKKLGRMKDAELNKRMARRHNESREKPTQLKNVKLNEKEVSKKNHHDSRTKQRVKNVETNEHEIIKKRYDDLSRKKPEVALSNSKNKQIPKIKNLQYYVKSSKFPKKRKNGMMSVMRVSFQGTDVLKGLEHFLEAGIATGPLPSYLYDKPKKTGATEFQFTV